MRRLWLLVGLTAVAPVGAEELPYTVDTAATAGYRMVAPTHFFDNDYAASAHGA